MQKLYWAITYFVIGYAIVLVTVTSLYQVPGPLKTSIGMITATFVFVDLCYRYFKKTNESGVCIRFKSVLGLMTLWALLSIGLDILLLVILMPMISNGSLDWSFFNQQSPLYWVQFPLFYVFGFVAQAIYNRVVSLKDAQVNQLS